MPFIPSTVTDLSPILNDLAWSMLLGLLTAGLIFAVLLGST